MVEVDRSDQILNDNPLFSESKVARNSIIVKKSDFQKGKSSNISNDLQGESTDVLSDGKITNKIIYQIIK